MAETRPTRKHFVRISRGDRTYSRSDPLRSLGRGGGFGGITALTMPSSRGASNRRRYGAEPLSRGHRRQLNTTEIHL